MKAIIALAMLEFAIAMPLIARPALRPDIPVIENPHAPRGNRAARRRDAKLARAA